MIILAFNKKKLLLIHNYVYIIKMKLEDFRNNPFVIKALKNPRSARSVLNYMCGSDTEDPSIRESLNTDAKVEPLINIWFASGNSLDDLCQPFVPIVRELKNIPPTLIGNDWDSLEGKVAKVLLADQLSRSCFRGTLEAFSFDNIGLALTKELIEDNNINETLKMPAGILYLLPWSLAHSENVEDLIQACDFIDMAIKSYPNFKLFEGRNKQAVNQHRQVLEKFGRYPQRNKELSRKSTYEELAWLEDKDNLPIWAGGRLSLDKEIN